MTESLYATYTHKIEKFNSIYLEENVRKGENMPS